MRTSGDPGLARGTRACGMAFTRACMAVLGALFVASAGAWADSAASTSTPAAAPTGLEPVFPEESPNLVLVEAEDAVSTNFAREPTLNFGVSGFRALQLNRSTGLEGVGSFYADYALTLPAAGTWELWYGGTPPGPKDESLASYASPLGVAVDAGQPIAVTRERTVVTEGYSPSYYWNRVADLSLAAGRHTIRFEVTEKRRVDGRYFFYLDCFFLLRKEDGKRLAVEAPPEVFPSDVNARMTDAPFPAIDDALIRIRDNPGATQPLVDASRLYTMLGDYLNALKYLNKAAALAPTDADIALLIARNRIWKGDLAEGLARYRAVLTQDPTRRVLWLEAGKVAAWNGRYEDSARFFADGLTVFPGDPDLTVNLGLAYLWGGKGQDAEGAFRSALALAGSDADKLAALARVYRINGYPDRAVQTYQAAITAAPRDAAAYARLMDTLAAMGRKADAEAVKARIVSTFAPSDRLTGFLADLEERAGLKDRIMAEYNAKLAANPDNLVLRQVLAQSYFWNGMKDKAVGEYRHILANYAYLGLAKAEARAPLLPHLVDRGYAIADYLERVPGMARQARESLEAQLWKFLQAESARQSARKTLEAAQQGQAKAKEGTDAPAAAAAVQTASDRLSQAEETRSAAVDALAGLVASAAALTRQCRDAARAAEADAARARDLDAQDAEAQAVFQRSTKDNRWRFDSAGELAELGQDLSDNDLSRIASARIALSERQAARAQAFMAPDHDTAAASSALYTLAQADLWGGKPREAARIIKQLSDDPGAAVLPPYFPDLAALFTALEGPSAPTAEESAAAAGSTDDPAAAARAAGAGLSALEKDAAALRGALLKDLARLHALYKRATVRAFYAFELEVSSIRNELGDYYLAGEPAALDQAIRQFRRVLAVDPADLNATFRLGKVYEWKRDWAAAMDAYRVVYKADPSFENVATLYNRLERQHAPTVGAQASAFADSQRVQRHGETTVSRELSSVVGVSAVYQADDIRVVRGNDAGGMDHGAYTVQDASIGLPLDLYLVNVKVAPWVGGVLAANGLYQKTDAAGTPVASVGDSFKAATTAAPYARVEASLGALNTFFLYGTARAGRLAETLDPSRGAALNEASVEASLTTSLAGVDVWLLRDASLRTYGKLDAIRTASWDYQNAIYTGLQEVTVNILKGGSPYGVLALTGGVTFQHSDSLEPYLFYTPPDTMLAGGSVTGSTWIGAGNGGVLGVSLRGYCGSYQENVLSASPAQWVKVEGQADLSWTRGGSTWTLTALGDATWKLAASAWDYWSLYARLGYTLKLPDLLAQ
jgi:Flp pilus assembly protein TadD